MQNLITLSRERIYQLSPTLSLNRLQIEAIGESWPVQTGWLNRLEGKQISVEAWNRAVALSDRKFAKQERKKEKRPPIDGPTLF